MINQAEVEGDKEGTVCTFQTLLTLPQCQTNLTQSLFRRRLFYFDHFEMLFQKMFHSSIFNGLILAMNKFLALPQLVDQFPNSVTIHGTCCHLFLFLLSEFMVDFTCQTALPGTIKQYSD